MPYISYIMRVPRGEVDACRVMEHLAYPKIGRSSASSAGGQWVLTEKIHGANFVIGLAEGTIRFGKRKAWLDSAESFFGW